MSDIRARAREALAKAYERRNHNSAAWDVRNGSLFRNEDVAISAMIDFINTERDRPKTWEDRWANLSDTFFVLAIGTGLFTISGTTPTYSLAAAYLGMMIICLAASLWCWRRKKKTTDAKQQDASQPR